MISYKGSVCNHCIHIDFINSEAVVSASASPYFDSSASSVDYVAEVVLHRAA